MWQDSWADDWEPPVKSEQEIIEDRRISKMYTQNTLDRLNMWAARLAEAGGSVEIIKDEHGVFVAKFA